MTYDELKRLSLDCGIELVPGYKYPDGWPYVSDKSWLYVGDDPLIKLHREYPTPRSDKAEALADGGVKEGD